MTTTPLPNDVSGDDPQTSPSHADQHNVLAGLIAGPIWVNVMDYGATGDGTTDDSGALQDAVDAIAALGGGTVYCPAGTYKGTVTIDVPSQVQILGVGRATRFVHDAAFITGAYFKPSTSGLVNMFAQAYGIRFTNFEIRDRASADVNLTPSGRSEVHNGIELEACDNVLIEHVMIRDLKGYALKLTDLVRECSYVDVWANNCGNSATSTPSVWITQSSTGDSNNLNTFYSCHIIYPEYVGLLIEGSSLIGPRQTQFTDCQLEGGGADDGVDLINPRPYDIVLLKRVQDVTFKGCCFSNPGSTKYLISAAGEDAGHPCQLLRIDDCWFEGNSNGGGIKPDHCTNVVIDNTTFVTTTSGQDDIAPTANAGAIWIGVGVLFSSNPFGGSYATRLRGKITPGGGRSTIQYNGIPTDAALGGGPEDGMQVWDVANAITWVRAAGVWRPNGSPTLYKTSGFALASSSTETSVVAYTVPANLLGTTRTIEFDISLIWYQVSGGAATLDLVLKLGATTMFKHTTASIASSATPRLIRLRGTLTADNSAAVQKLDADLSIGAAAAPTTGLGSMTSPATQAAPIGGDATEDTTAAKLFDVRAKHSVSHASNILALRSAHFRLVG